MKFKLITYDKIIRNIINLSLNEFYCLKWRKTRSGNVETDVKYLNRKKYEHKKLEATTS